MDIVLCANFYRYLLKMTNFEQMIYNLTVMFYVLNIFVFLNFDLIFKLGKGDNPPEISEGE